MTDSAPVTVTATDMVVDTLGHDGLASRVFLLASSSFFLAWASLTVMAWFGKIDGPAYVESTKWLVTSVGATYGLSNVGQRLAAAIGLKHL